MRHGTRRGEALGTAVADAWIATKHGHSEALSWPVFEAGHPLPDASSIEAGAGLLGYIRRLPREARVLVLLSGGASALVECPTRGIGIAELRAINEWLLGSGLDIAAVNVVRKRLSLIKGGRLAGYLTPRQVLCLAISDVPGDDAATIASGPLVHDVRPEAALPVDMPLSLRTAIEHSARPGDPEPSALATARFECGPRLYEARQAAADAARRQGYQAVVHAPAIHGDAAENGRRIAHELLGSPGMSLHVWGGETSVRLPPCPGRGGRNQTLALAAATILRGQRDVLLLAAGTDGSDGPGLHAGALVDGGTVERGHAAGLDEEAAIGNADASSFLDASADLLYTGPTGTNVADLVLALKLAPQEKGT